MNTEHPSRIAGRMSYYLDSIEDCAKSPRDVREYVTDARRTLIELREAYEVLIAREVERVKATKG